MPATTNYGWVYPTEGGDVGTWDTTLNTLFVDADADVKAVEEIAVRDLTASNDVVVVAADGAGGGSGFTVGQDGSPPRLVVSAAFPNGNGSVWALRLPVRVGQRITAFTSRGFRLINATCAVKLVYITAAGVRVEVSAGHSLPASEADTTTSGLTHDVLTGRAYFIEFTGATAGAGDSITIVLGRVTVIATP